MRLSAFSWFTNISKRKFNSLTHISEWYTNLFIQYYTISWLNLIQSNIYSYCYHQLPNMRKLSLPQKKLFSVSSCALVTKKPWKSSIYFHCTLDNAIPHEYVLNVLYECIEWNEIGKKNIPGVKWRTLRLVSVCVVFGFLYAKSIIFSGRSDDKRRKFFSINVAVDIAEWLVVQFNLIVE